MPYTVRREGRNYLVVNTDTDEVKGTHKPPEAKKKADAQLRTLEEKTGFVPDKVTTLDNGTKVNIKFKHKEKLDGAYR